MENKLVLHSVRWVLLPQMFVQPRLLGMKVMRTTEIEQGCFLFRSISFRRIWFVLDGQWWSWPKYYWSVTLRYVGLRQNVPRIIQAGE